MKKSLFSSIILLCLITVLNSKHYLVEVDNEGPENTNLDQEENHDENAGETEYINERPQYGTKLLKIKRSI